MFVRVVRFTDVSDERIDALVAQIESAEGPPPGVKSTGFKLLTDGDQGTAVVLQHYATKEDMDEAAKVFDAMDSSETPGTRASVDACEVKVHRDMS